MRRLLAGIIIGLVLGFLLPSPVEGAPKSCVGKGARSCQTPTPVLTTTVTQTPTGTPTETATSTPTPTPTSTAIQCPPTDWATVYPAVPSGQGMKWCKARGFTVTVQDATGSPWWHPFIAQAVSDWDASTVLDARLETVPYDPACTRPGGDGMNPVIKVCNFSDNPWTEPADDYCNSVGCASIWTLAPIENYEPRGAYIRDVTVHLNDWWPEFGGWNPDIDRMLFQQTVCHEIGHGFGLDHWNPIAYADFESCMFNHGDKPAGSFGTLEQMYP